MASPSSHSQSSDSGRACLAPAHVHSFLCTTPWHHPVSCQTLRTHPCHGAKVHLPCDHLCPWSKLSSPPPSPTSPSATLPLTDSGLTLLCPPSPGAPVLTEPAPRCLSGHPPRVPISPQAPLPPATVSPLPSSPPGPASLSTAALPRPVRGLGLLPFPLLHLCLQAFPTPCFSVLVYFIDHTQHLENQCTPFIHMCVCVHRCFCVCELCP